LIQRNISFSNRTQSSNFPTRYSLVKEPPPLISGEDASCIICFFLSTTFFKVFSERRFGTPLFPAPWGFLRAAVPQRGFELCPKLDPLSNTFFEFFGKSFESKYNIFILRNFFKVIHLLLLSFPCYFDFHPYK